MHRSSSMQPTSSLSLWSTVLSLLYQSEGRITTTDGYTNESRKIIQTSALKSDISSLKETTKSSTMLTPLTIF